MRLFFEFPLRPPSTMPTKRKAARGSNGSAKEQKAARTPSSSVAALSYWDKSRRTSPSSPSSPSPPSLLSPPSRSLPPPRRALPPHQLVLAPMVGASELPFRLLARRQGAQLCYTPMIHSDRFVEPCFLESPLGVGPLQTNGRDAPLVAHFCGNDPDVLLAAGRRAEPYCVAVDLNLGCPQRSAHSGHYGAFLLDPPDRPLVLKIVERLARGLRVPVFCKVRLLEDLHETLAFAKQLEAAGCALLAVHGRYRGHWSHRRTGAAHLDQVAAVKAEVNIPVLTNGNVRNASELIDALRLTGADGVMSAEGALDDPAIFARASVAGAAERAKLELHLRRAKKLKAKFRRGATLTHEESELVARRKDLKASLSNLPSLPPLPSDASMAAKGASAGATAPPTRLELAFEYLSLVATYPAPLTCVTFHLRRMAKRELAATGMLAALLASPTLDAAADVMRRCRDALATTTLEELESRGAAIVDAAPVESAAATADRAAAAAASAAKRERFVQRMRAKALREGRDAEWYLRQGRRAPTVVELEQARHLKEGERKGWWQQRFGQHCLEFHLEGACPWERDARGCGFLHEAAGGAEGAEGGGGMKTRRAGTAGRGAAGAHRGGREGGVSETREGADEAGADEGWHEDICG